LVIMVEPGLSRSPTRTELHAWRTFLTAHARVMRNLEAELLAAHRLSLVSYDVLVQLAEAPERRLRMAELADRVLLSRSGVTRLVDRLERAGLVSRQRVAADGRGVIAELTAAGLERLRTAAGTHLTGITRHFTAHFTPTELHDLADLCTRLTQDP
jgi:DNA-binding MarR family transcriptional regulator